MKCRYNSKNELISIELSLNRVEDIVKVFKLVCNDNGYVYLNDHSRVYKFASSIDINTIEKLLLKGQKYCEEAQSLIIFSNKIENPKVDHELELLKRHDITFLFEFDYGENLCHIILTNTNNELAKLKNIK